MNREKILNTIGFSLLALCFVVALGRVFTREKSEASDGGRVIIRFAHWQLEGGVRDAFDRLAREYEALHPGVKVEQMAIPERIARNWARTQFVGGTAPDLVQLGMTMGTTEEVLSRYFEPLTSAANEPNPYNAGTELAAMPWRETILDGMAGRTTFPAGLLDYYGVPSSMFSVRMYYNTELWRVVTGGDAVPQTFEEFIAVCRKAQGFEPPGGAPIIAIAGSKFNAPMVMRDLFKSQTQKLRLSLTAMPDLNTFGWEVGLAYVQGRWSWQTPAVRSGLELVRQAGKFMQPGFLSLGRDDALFYFAQQRALMVSSGSYDATSLRVQVPFEIGVFRVPAPTPDDPKFGEFTFGNSSEAGTETGLAFGITKGSRHPEVALDFLQFLTSKSSNATFSEASGWLPAVVGVDVPEKIKPFELVTDGTVQGFSYTADQGADTDRIVESSLHKLVGPNGSVPEFADEMQEKFGRAVRSDLARWSQNTMRSAVGNDAVIGAYEMMRSSGDTDAVQRADRLMEAQTSQEASVLFLNQQLQKSGQP